MAVTIEESVTSVEVIDDVIYVTVGAGIVATLALNDLMDVDTTGVGDNDGLTYDLATGTWIPEPVVPGPHAVEHEDGGGDEIDVTNLSGVLADPQIPEAHVQDEATVTFDPVAGHDHDGVGSHTIDYPDLTNIPATFAPSAHAGDHENGGGDEISLAGLSGEPADAIPKSLVDAKADIIVATADDTPARLAVGADTEVLTADSAEATGLKWAPGGGGGGGDGLVESASMFRVSGRYHSPIHYSYGSAWVCGAGVIHVIPFLVGRTETFDRIGISVTGGYAAGRKIRLGIYGHTDYRPSNLILDSGEIECATVGLKEAVISQELTPDAYFLVLLPNNMNLGFSAGGPINQPNYWGGTLTSSISNFGMMHQTIGYGALPDPFPAGTPSYYSSYMLIVLRKA